MSCLNHFGGYIQILGTDRLPRIMSSVSHLQRLLLALVYTIELDCSDISLLEDVAIKGEYVFHFDVYKLIVSLLVTVE